MAGKEIPSKTTFKAIPKKMTIEEISKENKETKDNKKDIKDLMKVNRELFEEIVKTNKDNSNSMEERMGNIGNTIAESVGKEMKNSFQGLFEMMRDLFKQETRRPAVWSNEDDDHGKMDDDDKEIEDDMFASNEPSKEKIEKTKNKRKRKENDHELSENEDENEDDIKTSKDKMNEKIQMQDTKIEILEKEMEKIKIEVEKLKKTNGKTTRPENENIQNENLEQVKEIKNKVKTLKPAILIDNDGNEDKDSTRIESQPIDWTEVVLPKRRWEKRPALSETLNDKVNEDLAKQFEEKYRSETKVKTKPQKEMSNQQRQKIIQAMLTKSGLMVGVGPISMDHVKGVEKHLLAKGILNKKEDAKSRLQRTVKSIVKRWANKNLKMEDRDWDMIEITNIILTDNSDIVFVNCKNQNDATELTSRAKNLPKDDSNNGPRLMMHVDRRAMKRHKAILAIAKSIRQHSNNTVQTSVRSGKNDFLLRQRPKGSSVPWSEIPPMQLSQEIPEFEIGRYKDLVNPENNPEDEMEDDDADQDDPLEIKSRNEDDNDDEDREMEEIIQDISDQNQRNKRDRSKDELEDDPNRDEHLRQKQNVTGQDEIKTPDMSENEDELNDAKFMNSTPITWENTDEKRKESLLKTQATNSNNPKKNEIIHYFSVQETPQIKNQLKNKKINKIPETPDIKKDDLTTRKGERNKTKTRRNYKDDMENDSEIINELVSIKKNSTNYNE